VMIRKKKKGGEEEGQCQQFFLLLVFGSEKGKGIGRSERPNVCGIPGGGRHGKKNNNERRKKREEKEREKKLYVRSLFLLKKYSVEDLIVSNSHTKEVKKEKKRRGRSHQWVVITL